MEKIPRKSKKKSSGAGVFLKSVAYTLLGFLIILIGYVAIGFLL